MTIMDEQTQTPQTTDNPITPQTPVEPSVTASPSVPAAEVAEVPTPAQQPTAAPSTQSQPGGKPKKILLVEDDQGLASVYTTRLQAEGFDVKHVPNGEDALAGAIAYKPDLVLLDVMMPKISGFDVLDIFRNTPETTNLKVVMLTALSQDADKERAMSLGVDDYLVKSQVVIAEVVDRIKHHLSLAS